MKGCSKQIIKLIICPHTQMKKLLFFLIATIGMKSGVTSKSHKCFVISVTYSRLFPLKICWFLVFLPDMKQKALRKLQNSSTNWRKINCFKWSQWSHFSQSINDSSVNYFYSTWLRGYKMCRFLDISPDIGYLLLIMYSDDVKYCFRNGNFVL